MGRGGTKFESEAIGVRSGRVKKGLSAKDIKKEMEIFKKTGIHPTLQTDYSHVLPTLPVRDQNRPHVFFNFVSGKTDLGRVLVEVFEPELPTTCKMFLNRCAPGAQTTYKGTKVTRVVQNYAMHGGVNPAFKGAQQRTNGMLRHVQAGLVSVSRSGDALAITFEQALTMDETHQVVGRVHGEDSMKILQRLNSTAVGSNDEPLNAMRISDCGQTDYQGNYDPLLSGSHRRESAKDAEARLQKEGAAARDSVGSALEEGLMGKISSTKVTPGIRMKGRKVMSDSDSSGSDSGQGNQDNG